MFNFEYDRKMKNEDIRVLELKDNELEQVTGGTIFPNTYSASGYNEFGISTKFHVFSRDEFYYMGRSISYDQANKIMQIGNNVKCSLNSGYDHKDNIGSSENAFIRAFNQQLKLTMGEDWMWNGVPGTNYGWTHETIYDVAPNLKFF